MKGRIELLLRSEGIMIIITMLFWITVRGRPRDVVEILVCLLLLKVIDSYMSCYMINVVL